MQFVQNEALFVIVFKIDFRFFCKCILQTDFVLWLKH